ncbi:hypothetical protein Tco_0317314, partial [Tanacetum coccineum]
KNSFEVEPDSQTWLLTTTVDVQALLTYDDELIKDSDDDDVFDARDEMDEDIQQADEEETQSPKPTKESSTEVPIDESDYDFSCPEVLWPYENIVKSSTSFLGTL